VVLVTGAEALYAATYVAQGFLFALFLGVLGVALRAFWRPLV
jgi:hypothetical protein